MRGHKTMVYLEGANKPMTADELADALGRNRGGVSGDLSELVERGLVQHDGKRPRRYWVTTNPPGKKALTVTPDFIAGFRAGFTEGLRWDIRVDSVQAVAADE